MNINETEQKYLNSLEEKPEQIGINELLENTLNSIYNQYKQYAYITVISSKNQRKVEDALKTNYDLTNAEIQKTMIYYNKLNKQYYNYYNQKYKNKVKMWRNINKILKLL